MTNANQMDTTIPLTQMPGKMEHDENTWILDITGQDRSAIPPAELAISPRRLFQSMF